MPNVCIECVGIQYSTDLNTAFFSRNLSSAIYSSFIAIHSCSRYEFISCTDTCYLSGLFLYTAVL